MRLSLGQNWRLDAIIARMPHSASAGVVFRLRVYGHRECNAIFTICVSCDDGQRYCSPTCRRLARQRQVREAGRRYHRSEAGWSSHRLRQHSDKVDRPEPPSTIWPGSRGPTGAPYCRREDLPATLLNGWKGALLRRAVWERWLLAAALAALALSGCAKAVDNQKRHKKP